MRCNRHLMVKTPAQKLRWKSCQVTADSHDKISTNVKPLVRVKIQRNSQPILCVSLEMQHMRITLELIYELTCPSLLTGVGGFISSTQSTKLSTVFL